MGGSAMPWLSSPAMIPPGAGTRQLVGDDDAMERIRRRAAQLLGIADAEQAHLAGLGVERPRELAGLLPRLDVRGDLALDEAAEGGAEGLVLGGVAHAPVPSRLVEVAPTQQVIAREAGPAWAA
jgi:hypothetical protein